MHEASFGDAADGGRISSQGKKGSSQNIPGGRLLLTNVNFFCICLFIFSTKIADKIQSQDN